MEWRGGDVTGLMPYSRLVSPPGNVAAEEPSELVTVFRGDMPEMIRVCQTLTGILVHVMVDRARHFTSSFLHDEKLVSLGKLAAGFAHELNNPASAITRAAAALGSRLETLSQASRKIGAAGLQPEQANSLSRVVREARSGGSRIVLSPLEREEREEEIAGWLGRHGVGDAPAEALADSGIERSQLDRVAAELGGPRLEAGIEWLAAVCVTEQLTREIQQASARVSELVSAVKGFTDMDRAAVPEPVGVAAGLENTVIVLQSKAKAASVSVSLSIEEDLPKARGFGGELNQVWANLLENAIDAAADGGHVDIAAARGRDGVVVRVVDNGPGVPAEIRDRIFDPFFTTKPVGRGTGLGLDIVRRLVERHNGRIELESVPGRTEFRVTIPFA
jgi:signal transduction histidine kinase